MDRPAVHRSSLPQAQWSQQYPRTPPSSHTYPRPLTAPYSPHDQQNPYNAPGLYPTVVSQQMPYMPSQPFPNTLFPGGYNTRPRGNSTSGDSNNSYYQQPAPSFPAPSPPNFPQAHAFSYMPAPPFNPPVLQPQSSPYSFPTPNQTQDEVPIRPSPMFARRSSSSPAVNRIPAPDVPPPIPPLPPSYQSNNLQQHIPPRVSPAPPPSPIPIPSPGHSYRSESSPLFDSPFEASHPPYFTPPQPSIPSPSYFPTSSPPKFEGDVKRAPVDDEEEAFALAIALSEKESIARSGTDSQEDEDLAKAIEESIKHASSFGISVSDFSDAGPSTFPKTTSPLSVPPPLPVSEPSVPPLSPLTSSNTPYSLSRPASKMPSPLMRPVQPAIDDEALAQRLAEEEHMAATAGPSNPKPVSPILPSPKLETATPPAPVSSSVSRKRPEAGQSKFTVVNADSESSAASRKRQEANQSKFAIVNSDTEPPPPLYHHVVSAQTTAPVNTSPTLPNRTPFLGRSSSASAVISSSNSLSPAPGPADKQNLGRSQSVDTGTSNFSSTGPSPSVLTNPTSLQTVDESSGSSTVQSPTSPAGPAQPNSFIDQQLLYGVCKCPRSCAQI
jgi:hypothetical protein